MNKNIVSIASYFSMTVNHYFPNAFSPKFMFKVAKANVKERTIFLFLLIKFGFRQFITDVQAFLPQSVY